MPMRIVSVNVGRPAIMLFRGRTLSTAINRRPAEGPVLLTVEGFEGDRVSDSGVHGGPDKAVCCFPVEHYPAFTDLLNRRLTAPSFGENLTTEGLLETQVCVGDVYRVGQSVVQVSQPRQPCGKLAMKHATAQLPEWINQTGFTGFYLRVLEPGTLGAGDGVELQARPNPSVSMALLNEHRFITPPDEEMLQRIAAIPELSAAWRNQVQRRLAGAEVFEE